MVLTAKSKHVPDSVEDVSSISSGESDTISDDEISEYEKAALRRREENQQLLKKLQIYRVRHVIITYCILPYLLDKICRIETALAHTHVNE